MEFYDVKFKKKFGQNFLRNDYIVRRIVNSAEIDDNSLVIEVGPGGAIMTRELASEAKNVLAYEIDQSLEDELSKRLTGFDNVKVLFQDFLNSDLCNDVAEYNYDNLYFVSNVPYYITTPIILKLLNSGLVFKKIVMMVQKEVGERFSAKPGSKQYGSISVLLQYYYDIKREFIVNRKEFVPVPNVDSVVVSFTDKDNKLDVCDRDFFEKVVRDSFQFRRKTIRNNLKNYDLVKVQNVLNKYNYDLNVRAEMLDLKIFVDMANELFKEGYNGR